MEILVPLKPSLVLVATGWVQALHPDVAHAPHSLLSVGAIAERVEWAGSPLHLVSACKAYFERGLYEIC